MVNKGRSVDVLLIMGVLFLMGQMRVAAAPMGTAFTYQGRFTSGGNPANGAYDFEFKLFDAATAGSQVGSTVTKGDLSVSDGYFTTTLDFGATPFGGDARWLQIAVRPGAETGAYTTLTPRHELTPTPYTLYAGYVGTANYIPKFSGTGLADSVMYESSGNIGIGTTSPGQRLVVAGAYSPGNPVAVAKLGTLGFGSTAGDRVDILLGGTTGADFGRIRMHAPGSSDMAMNLGVWNGTSIADILTLKKNGNVGIGTTAPVSKLEVAGQTLSFPVVASSTIAPGTFTGFGINGYLGGTTAIKSAFVKERLWGYGVGKVHILNDPYESPTNADLGDARITIDVNGNVGIGTTSPAEKLHVAGGYTAVGIDTTTIPMVIRETDQGLPAGLWRVVTDAGTYRLDRNTAATGDFATYMTSFMVAADGKTILADGNTGVGTTWPIEKLDVNGKVRCTEVVYSSDEQLKTDVQPLSGVLDRLSGVRAVSFRWNEKAKSLGATTGTRQIGVLAQELERAFPEMVTTPEPVTLNELLKNYPQETLTPEVRERLQRDAERTQYKAVSYSQLTAVLLEAVKELQAQNRSLEQRIQALENRAQ